MNVTSKTIYPNAYKDRWFVRYYLPVTRRQLLNGYDGCKECGFNSEGEARAFYDSLTYIGRG